MATRILVPRDPFDETVLKRQKLSGSVRYWTYCSSCRENCRSDKSHCSECGKTFDSERMATANEMPRSG